MSQARVYELFEIIRKAEQELADIRALCKHPSYSVAMWSWRPGSMWPSRICDECRNCIPGITDEEYRKCNAEFEEHGQHGTFTK